MKLVAKTLLFISAVILLVGCGDEDGAKTSGTSGNNASVTENSGKNKLVLKGMYLGMTKSDFESWVKDNLGKEYIIYVHPEEDYTEKDYHEDKVFVSVVEKADKSEDISFSSAYFVSKSIFDDKGELEYFALSGSAVDTLFNSSAMNSSDFARNFMDTYDMPELSISSDGKRHEYTSPRGYKVSIGRDKRLVIRRIADTAAITP